MAESWQRLGVVVLPLLCVLASDAVGASMFIAAFVAGLAVQVGFEEAGRHSVRTCFLSPGCSTYCKVRLRAPN